MNITTVFNANNGASVTSKPVSADVLTSELAYWDLRLSSTGTIALQGSLDGVTFNPLPLPTGALTTTFTASGLILTARFPYMRAVISANAGTITLFLGVT